MKAIAKRDINITGYDYINFIIGNKYNFTENKECFLVEFIDEQNNLIVFCGEPKHLEDKFEFDFVEE
jgi:hypothetical protein